MLARPSPPSVRPPVRSYHAACGLGGPSRGGRHTLLRPSRDLPAARGCLRGAGDQTWRCRAVTRLRMGMCCTVPGLVRRLAGPGVSRFGLPHRADPRHGDLGSRNARAVRGAAGEGSGRVSEAGCAWGACRRRQGSGGGSERACGRRGRGEPRSHAWKRKGRAGKGKGKGKGRGEKRSHACERLRPTIGARRRPTSTSCTCWWPWAPSPASPRRCRRPRRSRSSSRGARATAAPPAPPPPLATGRTTTRPRGPDW
jgi:hypothetical protein